MRDGTTSPLPGPPPLKGERGRCWRPLQLVFAAVAAVLLATAPAAAKKDDLVIGITQFPSTFNPLIDAMLAKSYILAMTRRPITTYDQDWKLICLVCTELPTIENGLAKVEPLPADVAAKSGRKEGIALTVKLHPRATWGDGVPVTAKDVLFTWEVGKNPVSGVSNVEAFKRILKIDVIDEKTVVFHVDRVTFDYNSMSGFTLLPAHLERPKFDAPVEYKNRTTFDTDTNNKGLYFGPYRISEVKTGSHVVLVPNETWWGKPPHFKRIVVRVISNTAALEANLRSGSIDYIAGELGLTIDQALAFERRHGAKYDIAYKAGLIYEHLDVNLDSEILKDRRVRRALLHGLDRETLVKALFGGKQPVAHSFMSPLDRMFARDVPAYAFDRDKARALLDAAGWADIKNGVRHNKAGEPLRITLMTTADNRSRETVQQVIQSQWRELGVDVRIRNEPARVFFGQTVTQRKFEGLAMFAWISSPENVPRTTLHSEHIPAKENNFSGQNYTGFRNAKMDALLEAVETELDDEKRRAIWRQIQEIYAEELPVLPLFFRANPYIMPKWLKGVRPTGHQFPSTLWVEEWSAAE